jgi:hypothetical protein
VARTEIYLVGHGDAVNSQLSATGINQSIKRRDMLGKPGFSLVISPPETQAINTAEIISGHNPDMTVRLRKLSVSKGKYGKVIDRMVRKIGNAPLNKYFADNDHEHSGHGQQCLENFGREAWNAILEAVSNLNFGNNTNPKKVLVVGYPVLLPMVTYIACVAYGKVVPQGLPQYVMPECGTIRLVAEGDVVVDFDILEDIEAAA